MWNEKKKRSEWTHSYAMLLRNFFVNHYAPMRLRGTGSGRTARLYELCFRRFHEFTRTEPTLADLNNETVSRFLAYRSERVSLHSVERERNQLLAIWRLAHQMRFLEQLPLIQPTPLPRKIPKAWSVEELHRLLEAAASQPGMVGRVRAGAWWPALIHTLFESSERIGAILACRPSDLDGQCLTVQAEYRKGGRDSRVYYLSPETAAQCYAVCGRDRVFEWDRCPTFLWDHFKGITKRAGLYAPRLGFHTLRRSAASHYAAAGGNPSVLLGHSDPRVTKKYLDPRITERSQPKPYELLPRLS